MTTIAKICRLLAEKGITQVAMERSVGLAKNRISKWKEGTGEPTARQIWEIARALRVPVEYLLDDDQDRPKPPPDEEEEHILWLVRELGYDEAKAQLLGTLRRKPKPPGA
jgi:transcriptional regulator with XRE-family HTH domain